MRKLKVLYLVIGILLVIPRLDAAAAARREIDTKVIAMCQPSVGQIRNIVELFEKDLIPLKRIVLLGVYHENEETDYLPSRQYIKDNQLEWVTLRPIRGSVPVSELFQANAWTEQFREIFDQSDGIIFTGGEDIPPAIYGQEQNLMTDAVTPIRSGYEISFLFHLLGGSRNPGWRPLLADKPGYPVLAICLGAQSLNVACGGTLIQDIPSQVYGLKSAEQVLKQDRDNIHSSLYLRKLYPGDASLAPAFHRIRLQADGLCIPRWGFKHSDTPVVLTSHHQAIDRLGSDLKAAAFSMDGRIIEAVEHSRFANVLGVQFHPEPYQLYQKGLWLFQREPGTAKSFNPREFLDAHPPSMGFHRRLWNWFAAGL